MDFNSQYYILGLFDNLIKSLKEFLEKGDFEKQISRRQNKTCKITQKQKKLAHTTPAHVQAIVLTISLPKV